MEGSRGGGTGARASDLADLRPGSIQTSDLLQGSLKQQSLAIKVPAPCRPAFLFLCPLPSVLAQEKFCKSLQELDTPESRHVIFPTLLDLSPVFKLTLCYASKPGQPASCLPPSHTHARALAGKRGHGPPSPRKTVNQRGRASASGEHIPTDTPSWRPRQFNTPIPRHDTYLIILRIDLRPTQVTQPVSPRGPVPT